MSTDQVRWKMNILQKKYKECCDNNNKSGRGKMEFKWYDQMDEIFGKNKDAIAAHTVSSQIIKKQVSVLSGQKDVVCTSKSSPPAEILCVSSSPSASTSAVSSPSASPLMNKNTRVRPRHGTGSNLAQKKLNIEQQWLKFLEQKEQRDTDRDVRHAKSEERATENLSLKKQIVSLKRKQLEQKKELLNKKLKEKENRHAEMMKIEETKCKLLKKLLFNANVKDIFDDSDE